MLILVEWLTITVLEMIVCFVYIGMVELLTITVLEVIVCFVDIGMVELLTITVLEVIVCFGVCPSLFTIIKQTVDQCPSYR